MDKSIVNFKDENILDFTETVLVQQCNCFATQGAGLAKQIVNKWPEVLNVDKVFDIPKGIRRLGNYSRIMINDTQHVVNMYSQFKYGRGSVHTDMEAMSKAFESIVEEYIHMEGSDVTFAIPYGIGSGLAGGNRSEIHKLLIGIAVEYNVSIYFYSYNPNKEKSEKNKVVAPNLIKFAGHTGNDESKAILSNWYPSPFTVGVNDYVYRNVEEYMMIMKARLFKDSDAENKIKNASTPKEFKAIGRTVKNFDPSIWNEKKESIVLHGIIMKFINNPKLLDTFIKLGDSGGIFVECAPWDKVWGIGLRADDPRSNCEDTWLGQNLLGKCLDKAYLKLKDMTDLKSIRNLPGGANLNHLITSKIFLKEALLVNIPTYFIHGSWNETDKEHSKWSYLKLTKEKVTHDSGLSNALLKNVTGDLMALMKVGIDAIQNKHTEINVILNGNLIQSYLDDKYKFNDNISDSNKEMILDFKSFMNDKILKSIKINFIEEDELSSHREYIEANKNNLIHKTEG